MRTVKFLAPLQEGLLTKARHVLPSHPDPGQVLVVLKSQRKELKEASGDCSRRRGSGDASVRPHECRGSQEELLSSSANQAPGAGRGQVLAPMSLSPRATGEQQSLRGGSGGVLVASLHRAGALRSGWGRADNSWKDKDTRDCCLINSGEGEYQALVLIHPLAKDIVFLSLL